MNNTKNIFFKFWKKSCQTTAEEVAVSNKTKLGNDEELAVIAMALHLYHNTNHDTESEVITIDMPSAHYSPWAQKHLIHRRNPRKN